MKEIIRTILMEKFLPSILKAMKKPIGLVTPFK
jgi:hypothetical protein